MGEVVRFNRALRRQHAAHRRREDRSARPHVCAVETSRLAAQVPHEVGVTYRFFHDLHRALGEPRCAHCPRCSALKGLGQIDTAPDRGETLLRWGLLLADERDRVGR